jgi:hypothetical protein
VHDQAREAFGLDVEQQHAIENLPTDTFALIQTAAMLDGLEVKPRLHLIERRASVTSRIDLPFVLRVDEAICSEIVSARGAPAALFQGEPTPLRYAPHPVLLDDIRDVQFSSPSRLTMPCSVLCSSALVSMPLRHSLKQL